MTRGLILQRLIPFRDDPEPRRMAAFFLRTYGTIADRVSAVAYECE